MANAGSDYARSKQRILQKLLDDYSSYLEKLGFPPAKKRVTINVENTSNSGKLVGDIIIVDPESADDDQSTQLLCSTPFGLLPRRNGLLLRNCPLLRVKSWSKLLYGLACYLACSFVNNPKGTGNNRKVLWRSFRMGRTPSVFTLSNDRKFIEVMALPERERRLTVMAVWGGAFWEIREKLGPRVADSIIASVWLGLRVLNADSSPTDEFIKALSTEARKKGNAEVIDEVLRGRQFPIHR